MTPSIEAAQAFIEQTKDLGRDAFKALYAALTHDVKKVYRQLSKAEFFTPERARTAARTDSVIAMQEAVKYAKGLIHAHE
jgi:hypothetical protein